MANCSPQFQDFNITIKLSDSRKKSLKDSRKEIRNKIRKYFDDKKPDEIKPKFKGQGSFETDTSVNPIPVKVEIDGEEKTLYKYDIDDGVYFIGDEDADERKSIQTYHTWIFEAVDNHTSQKTIDKNTCVRIMFYDGHNIDLPIYYKQNEVPELAHKSKGWTESDPKEFIDWFEKKIKEQPQLRRIVRYLKAWADFRIKSNSTLKLPSGFILTILASENFYSHSRDDISLKETLVLIHATLQQSFECLRPTTPRGENLLDGYSEETIMKELEAFIKNAKKAIEEKNHKRSCQLWQKSFGERFSCANAKDEIQENKSASIATTAGTTKPWHNF